MYTSSWQGKFKIYSIYENNIEIFGEFIFDSLSKLGWQYAAYSYCNNFIDLYGDYPRANFLKIKKFIYDNYPLIHRIEPRKYGIRIFFKVQAKFIQTFKN